MSEDPKAPEEVTVPLNYYLVMDGTKVIHLNKAHMTFGRSLDNAVVVDDPRVSRHHMEIRVIRDHFVVFDLSSSGGTYVNGQRTNQTMLYDGDLISLAGVNFVFTEESNLPRHKTTPLSPEGPGVRDTVVFDTSSLHTRRKNKFWWEK